MAPMALHVVALGPRVEQPECGDASACLDERIPVARRDQQTQHQSPCPVQIGEFAPKSSQVKLGGVHFGQHGLQDWGQ